MGRQAEDDALKQDDIQTKMLFGPWNSHIPPNEPYHHDEWQTEETKLDRTTNIATRWDERRQLDNRAVDYLNLVEGLTAGPSSFSIAAVGSLVAASSPFVQRRAGRTRCCWTQKHINT
eukprot:CAMPEP_0169262532 /NCGR_PEP_ID=MMETSP1016-20121227/43763_1 /TAXON_ID=342587 /ORGANISM="Karlodinium micrum, Strain CCMP2283" /LENGTH=117 /DNA_ID=CAMNT_0009345075 /DNA_START=34 /DNA_END=383 /DNA_ORIENTATION=+